MLTLDAAPRLYPDSGTLYAIGDGKIPISSVTELLEAVDAAGAVLILSSAHFTDFHRRADDATRARVYAAIDRFPRKAVEVGLIRERECALLELAMRADPAADLPPLADLELMEFHDCQRDAAPIVDHVRLLAELAEKSSEANETGRAAALQGPPPSRRQKDFVAEFTQKLLSGKVDETAMMAIAEQMRSSALGSPGVDIEAARQMIAALAQVRDILNAEITSNGGSVEQYAKYRRSGGDVVDIAWASIPGGAARWRDVAPLVAPGHYLSSEIRGSRTKDLRRPNEPSDLADEMHVELLPYVDVATFDKETVALLERFSPRCRFRRSAMIVKNGRFGDLMNEVRALGSDR
jgi:hypothetical protein